MPAISPSCSGQSDRWRSAVTGKESSDRRDDAVTALGGNVRPGQAGIIVKHHCGCSRQIGQSGLDAARTRPAVAGHDEQPLANPRQGARVQHRRAQHCERGDALGLLRQQAFQIGRAAAGEMRRRDPAPVQKLNQAGTNLRVRRRFLTGGQGRRSVRHWLKRNVSWPSRSRRARSSAAPNACGGTSRSHLPARKPRGRCRRATSPDYRRPPCKA